MDSLTSAQLVAQFHREIARRQEYVKQLEGLRPFLDRDGWKRNKVEGERQRLKLAIDTIGDWLIMTAQEHFPDIALVSDDKEISIAHIIEAISTIQSQSGMLHSTVRG